MTAHSLFSASSAHRWMVCPGSIQLSQNIASSGTSDAAAEGSAVHCIAKLLHERREVNVGDWYRPGVDDIVSGYMADAALLAGQFDEKWVQISEEMIEHAAAFVAYCRMIPADVQMVEQRVDYSQVVPHGYGTADFIAVRNGHIEVVDLKYGKGVRVDAQDNEQGMLYALGALLEWDWLIDIDMVSIHIYQPRLDHITVADYTAQDIREFGERAGRMAILALSEDPPFVPGEKQCRWCPAAATCPTRAERALRIARAEFDDIDDALNKLMLDTSMLPARPLSNFGPGDISVILSVVDEIEQWCKDIRAKGYDILRETGGTGLPGWKLVEGRSVRAWNNEEEVETTLLALGYSEDDVYRKQLISPAQAETLLGKKKAASELGSLIAKRPGKPTLAPADDPRTAINLMDGSEFGTTTEEC